MKSALLSLALIATAAVSLQAQTTLRIRGSDTLGAKLVPQLAESFKKQGGKVSFDIAAEGSSTAFTNLAAGTAEIGMSSRKVKADERALCRSKGVTLTEFEIAWDMIVIVVNKNNPVSDLSKKQVLQIFAGDITDWSEVGGTPGPISLYTRNTSSGTYRDFIGLAMKGREYGKNSQKMAGNEQIGLGSRLECQWHRLRGPGLRRIQGHEGCLHRWSDAQRRHGEGLPLLPPHLSLHQRRACWNHQGFVDFCLSAAGDSIVGKVGFVPKSQAK